MATAGERQSFVDLAAMMALQGLLTRGERVDLEEGLAQIALSHAEKLWEEREKRREAAASQPI